MSFDNSLNAANLVVELSNWTADGPISRHQTRTPFTLTPQVPREGAPKPPPQVPDSSSAPDPYALCHDVKVIVNSCARRLGSRAGRVSAKGLKKGSQGSERVSGRVPGGGQNSQIREAPSTCSWGSHKAEGGRGGGEGVAKFGMGGWGEGDRIRVCLFQTLLAGIRFANEAMKPDEARCSEGKNTTIYCEGARRSKMFLTVVAVQMCKWHRFCTRRCATYFPQRCLCLASLHVSAVVCSHCSSNVRALGGTSAGWNSCRACRPGCR